MANASDYLKIAQRSSEMVEPLDVGKMFGDAGKGTALAQGIQDRRTLADIGIAAARGDMTGARNAAFAGGNAELGMKLDGHQREQIKGAMEQLQMVGKTAESQNDQQWGQSVQMFRQQGMNVPAAYEGQNGRLLAVAHSRDTMEKFTGRSVHRFSTKNLRIWSTTICGASSNT